MRVASTRNVRERGCHTVLHQGTETTAADEVQDKIEAAQRNVRGMWGIGILLVDSADWERQ